MSTETATPRLWFPRLVFLATLVSSSQVLSSTAEIKSPDLNLIVQRLEDIQHQDPAQSRPYEVTREYKVFRGDDKQPTSRRSGVTIAAGILQKAGMIEYSRGNVTIVNKGKLEEAACDCFQIIQRQKNKWQAET
jgi:hypothetical protein